MQELPVIQPASSFPVSISTEQTYKDCPLQFRYKHRIGLRKIHDEIDEHHLRFGAAVHAGLEVVYRARMEGEAQTKPATVTRAKKAFREAYPYQLDPDDNAKTTITGQLAIDAYVARYALEDARRWRVLAVEAPETYDSGYILHLDLVMEDTEYGGVYGFDLKTTKKKLDYQYWKKFEPNAQIARYTDYINQTYGQCQGFYIRAIQFGYRSRMYKGQPAVTSIKRLSYSTPRSLTYS
jgi:hypothetical protein